MKIALCNNNLSGIYLFRRDIYKHFVNQGFEVIVLYPKSLHEATYYELISQYCRCIAIDMYPNSQNPIVDCKLYFQLRKIYKEEKPDIVFNYTIKPNIYSALAASSLGIRTIDMMAGLGYVFTGESLRKRLARKLYKLGLSQAEKVIVLNRDNYEIVVNKYVNKERLILFDGGEGVNMAEYPYRESCFDNTRFLMVARLMYEKGFQQFVDAARIVKQYYPDVKFELLGPLSEDSPSGVKKSVLDSYIDSGIIDYLGETNDVPSFVLRDGTVVVVASYYMEGMNRSLMEACSMGRPIITTNMPGCKELVDDGTSGYCVAPKSSEELAEACFKFLKLSKEEKETMARNSYNKCKKQFDVEIVLRKYDDIINEFNKQNLSC